MKQFLAALLLILASPFAQAESVGPDGCQKLATYTARVTDAILTGSKIQSYKGTPDETSLADMIVRALVKWYKDGPAVGDPSDQANSFYRFCYGAAGDVEVMKAMMMEHLKETGV